jgi:fructosamine-3-kinase
MNKESKLYRELSIEELNKIVNYHFGETNQYRAKLLTGGLFNTTYHISFINSTKEIVLRVGPVNTHLLLPFENNLMRAEEYVYQLLREKNIPCSQVLVCDTSKSLINRDYMIVVYIVSRPLSEIELSEDIKTKLYYQVGMYTAKMHKITSSKFGRVSEIVCGYGYSSWSEYLNNEMSMLCTKLLAYSIFTNSEVGLFKLVLNKYKDLLNEIQTPHLVHADLWAGNILVQCNEDNYEVAAIIDADRAVFGDTDFEFASPWIINESFICGYGQVEGEKTCAETRKNIYRLLYSLIDTYVWSVEYDNQENSRNNKNNSLQMVQELLK